MTSLRKSTIFGACCFAAIIATGILFVRMRAGVESPTLKTGMVSPLLTIPRARFGGIVREVYAKTGDRVESGQLLVRFEAKELEARLVQLRKAAQAAEAAVKGGNAIAQIPAQVRQSLSEMHPDTIQAEQEYVDALAALDLAKGDRR